jgi:MFS family permease
MEALKQQRTTGVFYGWIIVAISALGLFFSGPGQTYSISIFIDYYIRDFGWSSTLVSGIYSSATLVSGSLLFIVGRMIDRFGQRTMSVAIGLLLAFACLWNSFVSNTIMLFIGFFLLRFLGQGSMTLIPNTLVPQWFIEKRGRAFSLMTVGGFLSAAAFPPINVWLIETFSWSVTWQVWAVLLLTLYVPLAYLLIRNRPENIGLLPDGSQKPLRKSTHVENEPKAEVDWTLQEAMRTRAFWLVLLCVSIPSLVNTGLTFHLVSILSDNGLKATAAAYILSLMAIIGFPVSFLAGYIVDKWKVHFVLGLMFVGQFLMILIAQYTTTISLAIIFGVVWGIAHGFERITLNIVWPNYFGRKFLGSIKGIAMTSVIIGSAFGPLPFGFARDHFGGYNEILYLILILPLIGMMAAFSSPPPKK